MKTLKEQLIYEMKKSKVSSGVKLPKKGDVVYLYQKTYKNNGKSNGFTVQECRIWDIYPLTIPQEYKDILHNWESFESDELYYEMELGLPKHNEKYVFQFPLNEKLLKKGVIDYKLSRLVLTEEIYFEDETELDNYIEELIDTFGERDRPDDE